jgi:threonine dehydratase
MQFNLFNETKDAYKRIKKYINYIPMYYSHNLSERFNSNIYFKMENLQRTGSFKIRGALNCLLKNIDQCEKGIIAVSAGNHAQGIALGAKLLNLNSLIVMPKKTPLIKINNTEKYGAKVILYGENYNESSIYAGNLAEKEGLYFIHPFNNIDVIAGQGTLALEILEEKPEINTFIVPVGGGGLISGIGSYAKTLNKMILTYGVQSEKVSSMYYSLLQNNIVTIPAYITIADGISVHKVEEMTFNLCKKHVDKIITVKENEIAKAILFLIEQSKLIVEGAGATPLAAILSNKIDITNKNVVLILSGGNIDVNLISRIINKGLAASYRLIQITVILDDTPGSLNKITKIIGECEANILDLKHNRNDVYLDIGQSKVSFDLEVKGKEHIDILLNKINKSGYEVFVNE